MQADLSLRYELHRLLDGGKAHVRLEAVLRDFPSDCANRRVSRLPYTAWQLLEHMRITQSDILEFIRNPKHTSPAWPEGYWPSSDLQADKTLWKATVKRLNSDHQAFLSMIQDEAVDLLADLPHAQGCSILREILLVADHNAYHIGQLVCLRRALGIWPEN